MTTNNELGAACVENEDPSYDKQGHIHSRSVADLWAGAENLNKHKCNQPTDRPMDRFQRQVSVTKDNALVKKNEDCSHDN